MKIAIIPEKQFFCRRESDNGFNLKAICIFAATGFFLHKDTYFNDLEVLQPATDYEIDKNDYVKNSSRYWKWYYSPRDISLKEATEDFAHLFEKISQNKLKGKEVILPLSGGLDSRTQAAALTEDFNVKSYSYCFEKGFDETKYGKKISQLKGYPFKKYVIKRGYLWKVIDKLAQINKCYADFTNPRQMAAIDEISCLGNIFYLGHWGDVLFNDMGVHDNLGFEDQLKILLKKLLKNGGLELADSLWRSWGLEGSFKDYLTDRISALLQDIKIDNANSRLRAFKSIYWAPRWTSANMVIFGNYHPLVLPYYDDEMCKFICTIPEHLLSGRQIQINYIKLRNPKLAKIPWQIYHPLNLYNYKSFQSKGMLPLRALRKGRRIIKEKLTQRITTRRNWEIQFIGGENNMKLKEHIFENKFISEFIPEQTVKLFYDKFMYDDAIYYSHSISMLLTLSMFYKHYSNGNNV